MSAPPSLPARHAARLVAVLLVAGAYAMTRLPTVGEAERDELAAQLAFEGTPLPEVPGPAPREIRAVHPDLQPFAGWISVLGAAVALNDFDGDGMPNDVSHVDPRTDQVIIAPVPGTGARYQPFALTLPAGPHDPATVAPMGSLGGDLNEDGRMDVLVYFWGRPPVAFLRRDAADDFSAESFAPIDIAPAGERWFTNAATSADLDGDGHLDLVIGNYFPDGSRVLDPGAEDRAQMQDSMSRAFNGGRDRLLRWTEASAGSEPTVVFTEPEAEAGGVLEAPVGRGWTLAVGAADLDGDLLPELYFANDFGPDRLLHNRSQPGALRFATLDGPRGWTTPASKALGHDSFKGMGVDFGDVNGDGHLDIYVSNIAEEFALEESHFLWESTGRPERMAKGKAPYVDRSEPLGLSRSGWGWGTRLADFDNDGTLEAVQATGFLKGQVDRWPELHELAMGNDVFVHRPRAWPKLVAGDDLSGWQHNPFFVRAASGRFVDVAPDIGLGDSHVTRGIATADVDGDGDLDLAVANQWEPSIFYRNDGAGEAAFLGLNLVIPTARARVDSVITRQGHPPGRPVGRPAIGATVSVTRPDGRRLVGQVDGGNGHSGARSPQLHFGLGACRPAQRVDVEIRWRDGNGTVRETTLSLTSGWHTVFLGTAPTEGDA